jgi:predicted AAA+ superfamily ATPase
MIIRHLSQYLKKLARDYPIVTLTGPRQSGKTTLIKMVFPDYRYVSLEDPDTRQFAETDPRGFLSLYNKKVIFDEIQRVPDLFSYLQTLVDEDPLAARFMLTGSQQFSLNAKISQTLAGRTALLRLLPLSLSEILSRKPQPYWSGKKLLKPALPDEKLFYYLFHGCYPRLYDKKLSAKQFYSDYVETYVTRDLQTLLQVGDLSTFQIFLRLLAGRAGQRVNLVSLGNDAGVSHTTIKHWLSVLQASYIVHLLPPHFKNFNKRLVKSPKIYFLDTGLLCYLLRVQSVEDLNNHPHIGAIFETFVFSEIYKSFHPRAEEAPLYFWQDRTGNEIDLLIDRGRMQFPVEVKAAKTIAQNFFVNIQRWLDLEGNPQKYGCLIYGGNEFQRRGQIEVLPWYAAS